MDTAPTLESLQREVTSLQSQIDELHQMLSIRSDPGKSEMPIKDKILALIESGERDGVTLGKIAMSFSRLDVDVRSSILSLLISNGEIVVRHIKKQRGPIGTTYYAAKYAPHGD